MKPPGSPASPSGPFRPGSPADPTGPWGPFFPGKPERPGSPFCPLGPWLPGIAGMPARVQGRAGEREKQKKSGKPPQFLFSVPHLDPQVLCRQLTCKTANFRSWGRGRGRARPAEGHSRVPSPDGPGKGAALAIPYVIMCYDFYSTVSVHAAAVQRTQGRTDPPCSKELTV